MKAVVNISYHRFLFINQLIIQFKNYSYENKRRKANEICD